MKRTPDKVEALKLNVSNMCKLAIIFIVLKEYIYVAASELF